MAKPLYIRHHRDLKMVPVLGRCLLHRNSSLIDLFCSKLLRYSGINPKVCQEAGIGRIQSLKAIYYKISCLYDNLEATLVGKCFQYVKEPTSEMDKKTVAVVRTNSHCKEEVVGHVQQKSA